MPKNIDMPSPFFDSFNFNSCPPEPRMSDKVNKFNDRYVTCFVN